MADLEIDILRHRKKIIRSVAQVRVGDKVLTNQADECTNENPLGICGIRTTVGIG